jgi:hypothetical protein
VREAKTMFAGKKEFGRVESSDFSILAASNNAKGRPALKRRVESACRPVNFAREKEVGRPWSVGDRMGWDGMRWEMRRREPEI